MEVNNQKTSTINILGETDIESLQLKINQLTQFDWDTEEEYAVNYNKTSDQTTVKQPKALHFTKHIIFRFVNKQQTPFQYIECSRWQEWSSILVPIMNKVTECFGYKNMYYPKVMLASLPAKKFIKPHTDGDETGYVPHKIHIPTQTNDQAFFFLENEKFHFERGMAYEVNNGKTHSVVNGGETDRIHLIFECLDYDAQSEVIQQQIHNRIKL